MIEEIEVIDLSSLEVDVSVTFIGNCWTLQT